VPDRLFYRWDILKEGGRFVQSFAGKYPLHHLYTKSDKKIKKSETLSAQLCSSICQTPKKTLNEVNLALQPELAIDNQTFFL